METGGFVLFCSLIFSVAEITSVSSGGNHFLCIFVCRAVCHIRFLKVVVIRMLTFRKKAA